MSNPKKQKWLLIIMSLVVIVGIVFMLLFPLKLGRKNIFVETWRKILSYKNFEKTGCDLVIADGHPKNKFTTKMESITKELYGVTQVSFKLFLQERKRIKQQYNEKL